MTPENVEIGSTCAWSCAGPNILIMCASVNTSLLSLTHTLDAKGDLLPRRDRDRKGLRSCERHIPWARKGQAHSWLNPCRIMRTVAVAFWCRGVRTAILLQNRRDESPDETTARQMWRSAAVASFLGRMACSGGAETPLRRFCGFLSGAAASIASIVRLTRLANAEVRIGS